MPGLFQNYQGNKSAHRVMYFNKTTLTITFSQTVNAMLFIGLGLRRCTRQAHILTTRGSKRLMCFTSNVIVMLDPQQLFYRKYRKYHAIHTYSNRSRHGWQHLFYILCSGLAGHLNDAQRFNLMAQIGGGQLSFLIQCILLAYKIYPNIYSLMTPY